MATLQEVFNSFYLSVKRGRPRATIRPDSTVCAYRGFWNNTPIGCAIGQYLIDSGNYKPEYDQTPQDVIRLMKNFPEVGELFVNIPLEGLVCLQDIHDNHLPHTWLFHLGRLADYQGLTIPEDKDEHPTNAEPV